jgi:ubiquinone biosynthesis protein
VALNPLAFYKSVINRFFLLYKHVVGLIIGAHIARVRALPPYKRKGLRSAGSRLSAFFLRWFIKKELRKQPFEIQLRRRLEMLGPTYIKLGQIMAIREDILPQHVTNELKQLLDNLPEVPFDVIQKIIEESLGAPIKELFIEIKETPLGSASIGQTHRATTQRGKPVVVKVIKPGIRETILSDLKLLKILANLLELIIPRYQPELIINEFCNYTEREIDLTYEADHAEIFAANFAKYSNIVFPKIYRELSSRDVLCMEYLNGIKPNNPRIFQLKKADQRKIINLGAGAIIKMLYEDGFFHADLHPANLIVLPAAKVGFIDLGMVGRFDEKMKRIMLHYFYALANGDVERTAKHLLSMAKIGKGGDPEGFKRAVSDLFRRFLLQSANGNFSLAKLIVESLSIGGKFRIFFPVEMTLMVPLKASANTSIPN